jgi:hypothetical protein
MLIGNLVTAKALRDTICQPDAAEQVVAAGFLSLMDDVSVELTGEFSAFGSRVERIVSLTGGRSVPDVSQAVQRLQCHGEALR